MNHSSISLAICRGLPQKIVCSLTVPRPETLIKSRTVGFFVPECRITIPKQRHRVTNWAAYDIALCQRGSLTVWFT